jgi:DNA-binding NarL/FixJ family response regulator/signal transduction histidine kinase
MLLVLGSVYGWALFASPDLHAPAWLIPFTGLMLLHAALHLISPRLSPRHRWLPVYFVAQGALTFALNQLTCLSGAAFGLYLYLALAAQAIGLLSNRARLAAGVAAAYLVLAALNFVWLWGWTALPAFLVLSAPQIFFVIALVVLFFRQANARKRAQELLSELETAHRQLAEYAARVEDLTLVNERQRLARELDDTLAQGSVGLILQLEAVDKQLAHGRPERAQAIAAQAMERARQTLADARRAIDDLRAGDSAPASLAERVRAEVERFTAATSIPCELDLNISPIDSDSLQEHAFRAVAEGLTNVARHARARRVRVRLAEVSDRLEIVIRDDGEGFDPAETNGSAGHYGLIGLRERVRLAGDALEVVRARAGERHSPYDCRSRRTRMAEPIRILIVDDHEIVRDGLRLLLEDEADFVVAGEAGDGAEAVRLTGELRPHVVLMDLRMPGLGGLEAIEQIRARWPEVAVVILTTYNEDELIVRGLRAGARGYLLKDTKRQTLFDTLRAAARGDALLQPDILARALSQGPSTESSSRETSPLTEREREVLAGVARGERSTEIAARLGISERTVKAYLSSIYAKLGVDSRAAAIAVAAERGLL